MAETMPTQTVPEQTLAADDTVSIKQSISKTPTMTETPIDAEQTNGHPGWCTTDTDVAGLEAAVPIPTTEPTNGTIAHREEVPAEAPLQTTTGEPNGTNGVEPHQSETPTAPVTTEEEDDTPLFSSDLISPQVTALLPEGYSMRPLRRSDYQKGFLDVLRVLTTVGTPSYATFSQHYSSMLASPSTYHTLIILDSSGAIVGTGSVFVEKKFIHNMGLVGHIEDIAVAKNQQGKKLGLRIIQALDFVAEGVGCYKCILDCSEANEGFYVKCGFKRAGLEMAHYYGRD